MILDNKAKKFEVGDPPKNVCRKDAGKARLSGRCLILTEGRGECEDDRTKQMEMFTDVSMRMCLQHAGLFLYI